MIYIIGLFNGRRSALGLLLCSDLFVFDVPQYVRHTGGGMFSWPLHSPVRPPSWLEDKVALGAAKGKANNTPFMQAVYGVSLSASFDYVSLRTRLIQMKT